MKIPLRTIGVLVAAVTALLVTVGAVDPDPDPERRVAIVWAGSTEVVPAAAAPSASPAPPARSSGSPTAAEGPLADPYRDQQWYLQRIGLAGERPVPDGTGQVVAVIDSGVDLAHPDLADALVRDDDGQVVGHDFVDGDDVPQDAFGHGTMVAGIVAARSGNGLGIAGVAGAGARILPVRVLDEDGRASARRVAAGIDWAVAAGATVLNLSLETAGVAVLRDDPALDAAIDDALAAGSVVVVAAGNGDEAVDAGGADGILVVGATDRADRRAGFSDRGRTDLVMAPGTGIVSTWCRVDDHPEITPCDGATHTYGVADGTSFAAPQVSGLLALLASTGMTPLEATGRLAATTADLDVPGPDVATGRGLVQLGAAMGGWPDRPVPRTRPSDPAEPVPAATPGDVEPVAVVGARPPDAGGLGTRAVVAIAILGAVAALARGLVAGVSSRARAARAREVR